MEIHKPKPVHSWRELLSEIGVVVIGVCIALGAEQAVEWLHWRSQVREARGVIATELASNLVASADRLHSGVCIEHRLDELADILDTAAKKGSLPPVGDINLPRHYSWPTGAWDSVVASQTATHFPRQQLVDFAGIYKLIQRLESFYNRENDEWGVLYTMVGPGRRLDPTSEADLRRAVSEARFSNHILITLSQQMEERIAQMHLPFTSAELDQINSDKGSTAYPICGPIGAASPTYGRAGGAIIDLSRSINQLKTLGAVSSDD